jgi:3-dehydroquinate dehydratase/shikimate dehydrogenase
VPILVEDPAAALADAKAARDAGADLVEFRVDPFFSGREEESAEQADAIARLVTQCPLAAIVTCRPVLEGGHYDGPDDARVALFERLAASPRKGELPPRYVDLELATYQRSDNLRQKVHLAVEHAGQLRDVETSLILSAHDFHTRPPDLVRRLGAMHEAEPCRVAKIAYRARSIRDNLELLDLLAEVRAAGGKPTVALAMGPFGLLSRVLAPKFDAFLTFASLRPASATAPGQPTLAELSGLYRFRSISPSTRVYGVIGFPVEHSLSPHVHNAGFEAVGHDGVYLPLPIPAEYEHLKASLLALVDHASLDFGGCSVTIPHKEHLVRLAREQFEEGDGRWSLDVLSERAGSANTLVVERDGRGQPRAFRVVNTDGPALVDSLAAAGFVAGPVLLVGAGGAARGVAAEFRRRGVEVALVNRTRDRGAALAAALAADGGGPAPAVLAWTDAVGAFERFAAVVNCTSVGMAGGPDADVSAVPAPILGNLRPGCAVVETVYTPRATPLLRAAQSRGLPTIDGLAMFVRQAAEQFALWTGRNAPTRLFETVASETLAGREAAARRP